MQHISNGQGNKSVNHPEKTWNSSTILLLVRNLSNHSKFQTISINYFYVFRISFASHFFMGNSQNFKNFSWLSKSFCYRDITSSYRVSHQYEFDVSDCDHMNSFAFMSLNCFERLLFCNIFIWHLVWFIIRHQQQ